MNINLMNFLVYHNLYRRYGSLQKALNVQRPLKYFKNVMH